VPESTKEDAGVAETREEVAVAVVLGGGRNRAGRESSCDDNTRNTDSTRSGGSTNSGVSVDGSGGGVFVIDAGASSGGIGNCNGGGVVGVVGVRASYRGGSTRLGIKGLVEGPANSSIRVATRVHPTWGTGARGVGPSAPSGRGGCPVDDDVPGRKVVVTTRNHRPMGANLTKQSRVSFR